MIIRIMGEGQLEVADSHLDRLNSLDDVLTAAIEANDDDAFRIALTTLLEAVREVGVPVAEDFLHESDLVLPYGDAHINEVKALLGDEGLIPD